ncbi:MAG: LysM peptidoglycan-binding domain-containing protein [Kordiimonadaceae bacterium]|nr:LysM peptidoglycan-binding domain-containing protein [Kordiimonadaceae bacterium]MBT6033196.1 LysM peptidoglycan-binding domain-containing protein [Kordiimonadaceae bacterium]
MSYYLNNQNKGQGSGLKLSLTLLAIAAISAVSWVIFLADDGADTEFSSEDTIAVETGLPNEEDTFSGATSFTVPSFDVVRISRNGTGVIAGRAEPNSDVIIYAREVQIGSAITDRNGEWVLLFDKPLPPGPTELSIVSRTQGQFEIASSDIVIVAVPERNEERFNNDDTDGVVAILSPRSGNGPSRVLQKPKNVNMVSATKGLSLDALDYTDNGLTIVNGSATSGANIRIYLDNEFIGDVTSGEQGTWTFEINQDLSPEEHIIRLDQLLLDGNVEVRISQPFNSFVEIDKDRATGDVLVKPGNSLWHIARKLYGSGYHYTVIFGANLDIIGDPNLIFPGQQLSLPLEQMQ